MAFVNHSMLEELKQSPRERWNHRVGRKKGNPHGRETVLGHTFSLILEEAAREGLSLPALYQYPLNIQNFIRFVDSYQEHFNRGTTLMTPTYYPSIWRSVEDYIISVGISNSALKRIRDEVLGPDLFG